MMTLHYSAAAFRGTLRDQRRLGSISVSKHPKHRGTQEGFIGYSMNLQRLSGDLLIPVSKFLPRTIVTSGTLPHMNVCLITAMLGVLGLYSAPHFLWICFEGVILLFAARLHGKEVAPPEKFGAGTGHDRTDSQRLSGSTARGVLCGVLGVVALGFRTRLRAWEVRRVGECGGPNPKPFFDIWFCRCDFVCVCLCVSCALAAFHASMCTIP